jgi:glycosyltransferase involved in cell wall biosynthesis
MKIPSIYMTKLSLSIVIPTYLREKVLVDTVSSLLDQAKTTEGFMELILVDQTPIHDLDTEQRLKQWKEEGAIKWYRCAQPHITRAMNYGLLQARGDIVLFTDDDIIPGPDLLKNHLAAYQNGSDIWAVAGQVLQPGEEPDAISYHPSGSYLARFLDFPFRRTQGMFIENAMAGNLSVVREKAIKVGRFDENFTPPVASRFETEFAKRLIKKGGRIWFEPNAGIRHLRAENGGTRSMGCHLNSMSPRYGVGDFYYALVCGKGWERLLYILRRPFREVRTKFHLRHPWWISVKFIGELRAITLALRLYQKKAKSVSNDGTYGEAS